MNSPTSKFNHSLLRNADTRTFCARRGANTIHVEIVTACNDVERTALAEITLETVRRKWISSGLPEDIEVFEAQATVWEVPRD